MGEDERLACVGAVYRACRISDRLFAMNPFLPRQNFYSQQLRALALVEVIAELHLPVGERNVLIVGAGVAGRTLAAAFSAIGASVRLIDVSTRDFERYRNAVHRELHPNIIFWPAQKPVPATALPFLNWAQASAKEVVAGLAEEWDDSFGHKIGILPEEVTAIRQSPDAIELALKKGGALKGDLCVLAMGFKDERRVGTLKSPSYWSPGAVADEDQAVLVSGSGDGGLIDVLSPILGTDVTRAAHLVAVALGDSPLTEDVAKVEDDRAAGRILGTGDSADDCPFYTKVAIPPDAARKLDKLCQSTERRAGRTVTFLHESTSPFSYTAAPINKLLLAHFSSGPRPLVKTVKGSVTAEGVTHRMVCSDGTQEYLDTASPFDKIIIRHGAEAGVVDLLDEVEIASLREQAERNPQAAMVEDYDHTLFRWNSTGMGRSGVRLHAMPKAVRRALNQIGRAYGIDIRIGRIGPDSFCGSRSIGVELSSEDRMKEEELKIFPLKIGPATIRLSKLSIRRNAPYDE